MLYGAEQLPEPVNRYSDSRQFNYIPPFSLFCLRKSVKISTHMFSIGLRSGDWAGPSITLILPVWNQSAAPLLVCSGPFFLLKHPLRHFLFVITI